MQKLTCFIYGFFRKQEEALVNAVEVEAEAGADVEQASGVVAVREAVVPVQTEANSSGMCLGYLMKRFITM